MIETHKERWMNEKAALQEKAKREKLEIRTQEKNLIAFETLAELLAAPVEADSEDGDAVES